MPSGVQESRQRETLQPAALSSAQLEQLTETLRAAGVARAAGVSLLAWHMRLKHCSMSCFPGGMSMYMPDWSAGAETSWSGAV